MKSAFTFERGTRIFKQALQIPVICVGGFLHREAMEGAIADGGCDMVSVARALIADPFLYRHMREGVQGPLCDFCNACFARGATWPVDCYNEEIRAQYGYKGKQGLGSPQMMVRGNA